MSTPISASTVWATLSAKPGISFSRSAALRNGASAASIRASNSAIVASICSIDQMLTDQEAMMVAQASVERCGNSAAGAGELLRMAEFGQPSRIALGGHDRLQDASAPEASACPQQMRPMRQGRERAPRSRRLNISTWLAPSTLLWLSGLPRRL